MGDDLDEQGVDESGDPGDVPDDTASLLVRLQDLLDSARAMPLSASVMVNREEFTSLLREAIDLLPEELRRARWLLKERDDVLARAEREAERIIEAARVRAGRMVERTEVVREARRTADEIVEQAQLHASEMRHEAEDYVDRKLAAFEVVLDRTMQAVQKGRERLQVHVEPLSEVELDEEGPAFFDQDGS
jgi:F0F1-type ATP synthase membrane subunit b/b'